MMETIIKITKAIYKAPNVVMRRQEVPWLKQQCGSKGHRRNFYACIKQDHNDVIRRRLIWRHVTVAHKDYITAYMGVVVTVAKNFVSASILSVGVGDK